MDARAKEGVSEGIAHLEDEGKEKKKTEKKTNTPSIVLQPPHTVHVSEKGRRQVCDENLALSVFVSLV